MSSEIPLSPIELNPSPVNRWGGRVDNLLVRSKGLLALGNQKLEEVRDAASGLTSDTKKLGRAAALAGGITLFTACGMFTPGVSAEAPTPIPTPTFFHNPDLVTNINQQSKVTIKVKPLEPPESSPTPVAAVPSQEQEAGQKLLVVGNIEYNKDDPSRETIFFSLPEEIKNIQTKNTLSLSFDLKSGTPITKLALSGSKWSGDDSGGSPIEIDTISPVREITLKDYIDDTSPEVLKGIRVGYIQNPDGALRLVFHFPSTETDEIKKILENFQFDLWRRGDLPAGTVLGPITTEVENFTVFTDGTNFKAHDFAVNPFKTSSIPLAFQSSGVEATVSEQNQEENRWQKDWQPNETVSAKEWFDDMVSRGYIKIDSIAQQHAGDEISKLINTTNLVPNPQEYWEKGYPIYRNLKTLLGEIVTEGQGHIVVLSEAYVNIPGGANCDVYYKSK